MARTYRTMDTGEEMNLRYGRIAMSDDDLDLLRAMAHDMKTYIEIGTLWGGSVITVALDNTGLQCMCIDPFIGYYGAGVKDKWADDTPDIHKVQRNMEAAGVEKRVTLIQAKSIPWPLPFSYTFDCGLIDGDHSPRVVAQDWYNLTRAGCKRIACHDMDDPAVAEVIEDETRGWHIFGETKRMRVYTCE